MRVLLADRNAATGEPWDFYWCEDGELLTLGSLCDRDFADDIAHCGCSRSFTGVDSGKATTAGKVAVLSGDEVAERLGRAGGIARAEGQGGPEWREMLESGVAEIADALDGVDAEPGSTYRVERRHGEEFEEFLIIPAS
jgi:hypothetical protein